MAKTNPSPTYPTFPGDAYVPTPNDTAVIMPGVLYCGTGGVVKVTTEQGSDISFTVVAGGQVPVRVIRVWATGLTAGALVMCF